MQNFEIENNKKQIYNKYCDKNLNENLIKNQIKNKDFAYENKQKNNAKNMQKNAKNVQKNGKNQGFFVEKNTKNNDYNKSFFNKNNNKNKDFFIKNSEENNNKKENFLVEKYTRNNNENKNPRIQSNNKSNDENKNFFVEKNTKNKDFFVEKNKIIVKNLEDFNIVDILECGQVFRFKNLGDHYEVYSQNKKAKIYSRKDFVEIICKDVDYFINFFDLNTDYAQIKRKLGEFEVLKQSLSFASGIRILRQDAFEMIISFIISANNNIKRIKSIIEKICEKFGDYLEEENFYAFPTQKQLLKATVEDFKSFGAGYRAEYLFKAIRQLENFDYDEIRNNCSEVVMPKILSLSGVGQKVADCILLFGFHKADVFPVDTWIIKVYNDFFAEKFVRFDNKILPKNVFDKVNIKKHYEKNAIDNNENLDEKNLIDNNENFDENEINDNFYKINIKNEDFQNNFNEKNINFSTKIVEICTKIAEKSGENATKNDEKYAEINKNNCKNNIKNDEKNNKNGIKNDEKRVLKTLQKTQNVKEIRKNLTSIFGDLSGFAQQYLFYYKRSLKE